MWVQCGFVQYAVRCGYFILRIVLVSLGVVVRFEQFGEHP